MKKILLILLCSVSTIMSLSTFAAEKQTLDHIVAVVNDDVITNSEVDKALATVKMQIAQEQGPAPQESALQKQVLDQLINKKLQLQMAKQTGVTASKEDVSKAIEHVASLNNVSVEMLYTKLNQEGMSVHDYRHEIHDQIVMQKLQQLEVVNHITVTPQEVDGFLRTQAWKNNSAMEYHLEDILIPISDTPSPTEISAAKKLAESVLAKLNAGKDFKEVAQMESKGANALRGGDLGWRKLPEIPTAFLEHVTHLKPKGLAGPIQTPNGFHILKLAETRLNSEKGTGTPDRKQIEQLILQRKFEEGVQNWVSRLRSQAFITITPDAHAYA